MDWSVRYQEAQLSFENKEFKLEKLNDEIEVGFELLGSTAIEDRLQDKVDETIEKLKEAGIKIWVLTGDKIETAINIGYSCKVLSDEIYQHLINSDESMKILDQLMEAEKSLMRHRNSEHAIIVGGESLYKITARPELNKKFIDLAEQMNVVLAC